MIKYPSIENHYRKRFIEETLALYPELEHEKYEISEKLHGSNTQLIFTPHQPMQVASRNKILTREYKHFGIWEILDNITSFTQRMQEEVNKRSHKTFLYGEIFGPGINKGVKYLSRRTIRFFDIADEHGIRPPCTLSSTLFLMGFIHLRVPVLDIMEGLQNALEFDCNMPSRINPEEGNIMEGIVIKPLTRVFRNRFGSIFYLKKKNEVFKERQKKRKAKVHNSPLVNDLHSLFVSYLTDQRLQCIFSKEGPIEGPKDIGKYISMVVADATRNFMKDHGDKTEGLSKQDLKVILLGGKYVKPLLDNYL